MTYWTYKLISNTFSEAYVWWLIMHTYDAVYSHSYKYLWIFIIGLLDRMQQHPLSALKPIVSNGLHHARQVFLFFFAAPSKAPPSTPLGAPNVQSSTRLNLSWTLQCVQHKPQSERPVMLFNNNHNSLLQKCLKCIIRICIMEKWIHFIISHYLIKKYILQHCVCWSCTVF